MGVKTEPLVVEPRVLLHTDWAGYVKIVEALDGNHRARVTYDRGQVEIMTISDLHGHLTRLLGELLTDYLMFTGGDFRHGGDQTFQREDLDRGFEPDQCLWVRHAQDMVGVNAWVPGKNPPPDVAVEVEITHGFIKRLPIYADFGVPEVWWYHDGQVEILRLSPQREYVAVESSPTFPHLLATVVAQHLALVDQMTDARIRRQFQRWLRENCG